MVHTKKLMAAYPWKIKPRGGTCPCAPPLAAAPGVWAPYSKLFTSDLTGLKSWGSTQTCLCGFATITLARDWFCATTCLILQTTSLPSGWMWRCSWSARRALPQVRPAGGWRSPRPSTSEWPGFASGSCSSWRGTSGTLLESIPSKLRSRWNVVLHWRLGEPGLTLRTSRSWSWGPGGAVSTLERLHRWSVPTLRTVGS